MGKASTSSSSSLGSRAKSKTKISPKRKLENTSIQSDSDSAQTRLSTRRKSNRKIPVLSAAFIRNYSNKVSQFL